MESPEKFKSPLLSIPERKLNDEIAKILEFSKDKDEETVKECQLLIETLFLYFDANIPVDYWHLDMHDFKGDKVILKRYNEIADDLKVAYSSGTKLCLAGKYGLGKTMAVACLLKRSVERGFSGFYTTLDSIVSYMSAPNNPLKYETKQHLMMVDFLVIDEFDPRYMGTSNASDLYGRILEPTLRHRIQNKLPLFLCTNSANVTASFSGALNESISSLMNLVRTIPVLGADYRPVKGGNK